MNNVTVMGRWTKNPELKYTPNGKPVTSGSIAVQRKRKDPNTGEYGADFLNIVIWGNIAETIANKQEKGNRIGITGRIETRNWEHEGKRNYITEIIAESVDIIDWAENGQGGQGNQNRSQGNQNQGNPYGGQNQNNNQQQWKNNGPKDDPFAGNGHLDIGDDDLPF